MGPIIGSPIYASAGFSSTFFIIGGVFFLIIPILFCMIPDSVNNAYEGPQADMQNNPDPPVDIRHDLPQDQNVSLSKLLSIRLFLLASMGGMMANFMYCYMEPVLIFHLSEFHISWFSISIFSIKPLSYMIVSILNSWLAKYFSNRELITIGAFF